MYKILLLTDFSPASRHAIAYTQALFNDTAVDFCLAHVCPIEPEAQYAGATVLIEQWQSAEKSLNRLRVELSESPEPAYHTYRTLLRRGEPVEVVHQVLAKEHEFFDILVVGATGSGWSELLGSVATDMIREAKTNVLVVPTCAPIRPLEQLVLATDYRSIQDAQSLRLLGDLASRKTALLTLLTIENPDDPASFVSESSRQYVMDTFNDVMTEMYRIHDDRVLHGINTYLKTHRVDLLVLLPHHKSLFDVLFHNSISRSVAFHPSVPLLTLYDEKAPPDSFTADIDSIPFATYL